jgi:hypothetical protein
MPHQADGLSISDLSSSAAKGPTAMFGQPILPINMFGDGPKNVSDSLSIFGFNLILASSGQIRFPHKALLPLQKRHKFGPLIFKNK